MTEFEKKRLKHFIKTANEHGWVHLGPGDANIFSIVNELHSKWEEVQVLNEVIKKAQEEIGNHRTFIDEKV